MKHEITITIDTTPGALENATDAHLAALWHVTQANPAPLDCKEAGELAEHVGREIIRRFVMNTPPALWAHQGNHAYWRILTKHGRWVDGVWLLDLDNPASPEVKTCTP